MKGKITITVSVRDEFGLFPITEKFIYERDNTYESVEEWIVLFNKILIHQGFHNSIKIGLVNECEE
jgi:hypothetical protein